MIQQITLRNFRRFERCVIPFQAGVNFIEGVNNAGKTTLLYAIEYALFGRVAGFRTPADLMQANQRDMGVELIIEGHHGIRYKLQRVHVRPPRSVSSVLGHFTLKEIDGEQERYLLSSDFQDHERTLTQRLASLLGISKSSFAVAVFARQGELVQCLEGMPQLDHVFGVTAAGTLEKELRAQALDFEKKGADLPVLQQSFNHVIQQAATLRKAAESGAHEINELESKLASLQTNLAEIDASLRQVEVARNLVRDWSERNLANEGISGQDEMPAKLTQLERHLGDLYGQQRRCQSAAESAQCPTCHQPVDEAHTRTEHARLETEIALAERELANIRLPQPQLASSLPDHVSQALMQLAPDDPWPFADPSELLEAVADHQTDLKISRTEAEVQARGLRQLMERVQQQGSTVAVDLATAERELARLQTVIQMRQTQARHAARLRRLSKSMAALQQALRENATTRMAEIMFTLHQALSGSTKEFTEISVEPKDYSVLVKPVGMKKLVLAATHQGGGHRLLLGLAYKLAVANLIGHRSFILLDEPTDGLDQPRLASLMQHLTAVANVTQMLVVTHHPDSMNTHRIEVARDGHFSQIQSS